MQAIHNHLIATWKSCWPSHPSARILASYWSVHSTHGLTQFWNRDYQIVELVRHTMFRCLPPDYCTGSESANWTPSYEGLRQWQQKIKDILSEHDPWTSLLIIGENMVRRCRRKCSSNAGQPHDWQIDLASWVFEPYENLFAESPFGFATVSMKVLRRICDIDPWVEHLHCRGL
jgi:hypothetical protein